jgi:glutamate-1-semialdehyde 2,1-aminomutase
MILAILQARVSSSRLPQKVLKPILGIPMLARQIERVQRSRLIDKLLVATSSDPSDDSIEELCHVLKVTCFRGSLDDVLDRLYQAAFPYQPDHVVRLTGDCPLADPDLIDRIIGIHQNGLFDYTSNTITATYPDGLDVEVIRFACLEEAWKEADLPSHREHVTPFIYQQPQRFKLGYDKNDHDLSHLRWTVDESVDFELVAKIYEVLYPKKPDFTTADALKLIQEQPYLQTYNTYYHRNAGIQTALQADTIYLNTKQQQHLGPRYHHSEAFLEKALRMIPLGSQTFSKSKTQYPLGVSPYFLQRGRGSHVWDLDGNEYIDFINGLAAITLGYGDLDVSAAVQAQLQDGVIFSLPHPLELQVAEKIVELVPCAEMVRFGKNGSDATSGAIRLARAYTGRDRIAVCGYHGWHDWYIGSTSRDRGVPEAVQKLTHTFIYNDLISLKTLFHTYPGELAAVILEPMNVVEPQPGFLEELRALTHDKGALLIFDETITGFRYAKGGAQEYFGVTPDLVTLGKGIANGYPLSAIAGSAKVMRLMEEIFFSSTFGGETLSLAAALATLTKLQQEPVIEHLCHQGQKILDKLQALIQHHQVSDILSTAGHPSWSFLLFQNTVPYTSWQIKTLFFQEVFARGILTLGTHNVSYSHTDDDITRLLTVYDEVFSILYDAVEKRTLHRQLCCQPLEPLFKVR